MSPSATPRPPSPNAPIEPRDRAFERHRAGRPGRHRPERRARDTSGGPTPCRSRSPIVSLPPATSAATNAASAGPVAYVSADSTAAIAATPVFAIALPAPRRPPRSSAMPSSVLRRRPSRDVTTASANVTRRSVHPPQPGRQQNRDAEHRADDRARRRDGPREIAGGRDDGVDRQRRGQRAPVADAAAVAIRSSLTSDAHHSTAPAVSASPRCCRRAGSGWSRPAAAASAATNGIASENHGYGGGTITGRHHQHRNDAGRAAGEHERDAARERLLTVPRACAGSSDVRPDQRRHAVAEREHAPRRGDDVAPVGQREEQQQNRRADRG